MEFLVAMSKIMMVNIVLSGDNAVVIAMASRRLPPKQQMMAILWGSAGAIGLRVILTVVAVVLLKFPYLQFIGGLLLVWIGVKLLVEDNHCETIDASDSLWTAIRTIIIADIVMSLDNTLAIAAIAEGNYLLLALGLGISIPLIICGSKLLVMLMDRFPIIIYVGAALIAWTAGVMINKDPAIGTYILKYMPEWLLPAVITVVTVVLGYWYKNMRADQPAPPDSGAEG